MNLWKFFNEIVTRFVGINKLVKERKEKRKRNIKASKKIEEIVDNCI